MSEERIATMPQMDSSEDGRIATMPQMDSSEDG